MFEKTRDVVRTAVSDLRHRGWEQPAWRCRVELPSPVPGIDGQIPSDLDLGQAVRVIERQIECRVERAGEEAIDDILAMQSGSLTSEELAAHGNWTRLYGCATEDSGRVTLKAGEICTTVGHAPDRLRGRGLHLAVHAHVSRRGQEKAGWCRRGTFRPLTPRGSGSRILFELGGDAGPVFLRPARGRRPAPRAPVGAVRRPPGRPAVPARVTEGSMVPDLDFAQLVRSARRSTCA